MTFSHWAKQILPAFGSVDLRKNFFIFSVLSFMVLPMPLLAQEGQHFENPEYTSPAIKSVRFHKLGEPFSYPIIALNSNQQLTLSFDETGTTIRDYYYTVELCNQNWEPAGLMKTEYYRGKERLLIEDFRRSFNTTFDYVHYQLIFPQNQNNVLLSGNYLLKVYQNYDDEDPVIVRRFMVSEQKIKIEADVTYTMQSSGRGHFQEIDFEVFHPGTNIRDPGNEVRAVVMQNRRTDNMITHLKPIFFGDDRMDFQYNGQVTFEGGNEFRWIDLRSFRFQSDHVKDINFRDPFYHVEVFPDQSRAGDPYHYHRDYNGRYYIDVQEEQEPAVSADYAFVHFSLKWPPPSGTREVYLLGGISNWQCNESNQMTYDYEQEKYTLTLLLKQGYYNYQYLVKEKSSHQGSLMPVEGSFGRTENDYLIMIYYRPAGGRYDRLLGTTLVNSLKQ
jgi:hypothetical protein